MSPAVVVPRMIKLKEKGYGSENSVPQLIMAGSSCDDIFVIILFYTFKNLVTNNVLSPFNIVEIPLGIVAGIIIGLACGIILSLLFKNIRLTNVGKIIILLGSSFGLIALENACKPFFSIQSLLAIIIMALVIKRELNSTAKEIGAGYNRLWSGFEILLFVLVGCATNVNLAFSSEGAIILGLIVIALLFRCLGVMVSICFTKYSIKEKLFIIISYLPKATVQASIGGIALSECLACGNVVLTTAVIAILFTAPSGAILMDSLYKRLLSEAKKDEKALT